jgi:hypothetical protein
LGFPRRERVLFWLYILYLFNTWNNYGKHCIIHTRFIRKVEEHWNWCRFMNHPSSGKVNPPKAGERSLTSHGMTQVSGDGFSKVMAQ